MNTTQPKCKDTFRIFFNNINSLGTSNCMDNIKHLVADQQSLEIDYLGITEHCVNTTQPNTRNQLLKGLRQHHLGQFVLQIDSGQMKTDTPYLPGGTAALLLGSIISRIEPQGRGGDSLGRWSYITLRRSGRPPLIIYTVYQVNIRPTNALGITAWHQQRLHLNSQGRTTVHPRTAFAQDLISEIQKHQAAGHDIIFGGDLNDTLYHTRSHLLRIATATNLIDPWTKLQPGSENFNTYHRGTKRIDAMFCSPHLINCITSIGYSPFNWFTNSDHRGLLIDFDAKRLFGNADDPLPSINLRGCRSNDRDHVATMIHQWHHHLTQNNAKKLINKIKDKLANHHDVELLDKLIGQGGDSGEKRCKRRRPEYYSGRLSQLRALKSITTGNLKALKTGTHNTIVFQDRINRHGLSFQLATTVQTAQEQCQEIQEELRTVINSNRDIRAQEQGIMIDKAIENGRRDKAGYLKAIRRQEDGRQTWQALKFVRMQQGRTQKLDRLDIPASWPMPNQHATSLSSLEDPKKTSAWKTITKPEEIEHYLQLRNRSHFGQAQGTPFTESPFLESIDWQASTETCDAILAGEYQDHVSSVPQCQALLQTCKAASELDLISDEITPDEFRGKIRSWRESTSTSPSGRHLGRYKILFSSGPNQQSDSEEENASSQRLREEQQYIADAILTIVNYCIHHGYVLHRWKTIVNTMIFKDNGNYKIHRLRVIHIYEADFNMLLAIKWRQLLHSAETNNTINPGLFGGRPGCEAQSLTFLEELKYDISYTSRRTLFNFDNDASSCYDRIVVSFASLINRKYGMHRHVVLVHATTLQQAQFHLRTQLGYSNNFYSHTIQYPIYGSGQGSGNSPCIWLFISSTLCDVHQTISKGARFISPDGQDNVSITMVGFVDDCTGTCNDFKPQRQAKTDSIAKWMEHDAQAWNDLLWCSGGKLELPKCSFHALQFDFLPDGSPKAVTQGRDYGITIKDSETGDPIKIVPKKADDSHKTLGHWKSPADPGQKQQLNTLLEKATATTTLISIAHLSRHGATLAYHGVYVAFLKYVLPQCFFTDTQLDRSERQTIQPILAKCGYNRHTATALRYAPISHAGCGFIKWSTLQGEGQIGLFLKHWRTNTMISTVLRIAFSWSQWQSGLSKSIFMDTRTPLPHLESRWIKSMRQFLRKINGILELDNDRTVPMEREGDIYIMEYAVRSKLFDEKAIKIINYCRLYLHITTVSELFDPTGTYILPHMFKCERPPWWDTTKYITIQQKPSHYQIRWKWQKLCQSWIPENGLRRGCLTLGPWTKLGRKFRPRRETYATDSTHATIYQWVTDSYRLLSPKPNASTGHLYPSNATSWEPQEHSIPISIIRIPSSNLPTFIKANSITAPSIPLRDNTRERWYDFQDYVNHLPLWESELLQHTSFQIGPFSTMIYIHDAAADNKNFYEVSEGVIKHETTSYGWIFGTQNTKLAWNIGPGFGPATSHRAECWGKLSAACFLHHLQLFTNQPLPSTMKLYSYSDNRGVITALLKRKSYGTVYPNATLQKDWDIIEQIHSIHSALPIRKIAIKRVRSTRIKADSLAQLPVQEQYHISATLLAEEYIDDHPEKRPISPMLPAARCQFQIKNETIHGHYNKAIREAAALPELFGYLQQKNKWSKQVQLDVQWVWFQRAATSQKNNSDNHLMKLVYGKLPTRYTKVKTGGKTWLPNTCRHCNIEPETFDHLLRCDHKHGTDFRKRLPQAVISYCKRKKVPHNFQSAIVVALEGWLRYQPPLEQTAITYPLRKLVHSQRKIGWTQLMRGFFSQQWQIYLEYEFNHDRDNVAPPYFDFDQFFSGLIRVIWTQQTTFWRDYQASLHQTTSTSRVSQETIGETEHEVRFLYSLRNQVLHEHKEEYFPTNLKEFMKSSSHAHLKNYITNYKPAIQNSLLRARKLSRQVNPLLTFPGFTKQPRSQLAHQPTSLNPLAPFHEASQPSTLPQVQATKQPQHLVQSTLHGTIAPASHPHESKERNPHKHTRWRAINAASNRFLSFFSKQPRIHPNQGPPVKSTENQPQN